MPNSSHEGQQSATRRAFDLLGPAVPLLYYLPFALGTGYLLQPTGTQESALALGGSFVVGTAFLVVLALIGGKNA